MNHLFQKKSITRRTCFILCVAAVLQGVIFFGFISLSNTFSKMTQDAHNVLAERVDYRRKSLEAIFTQNINNDALFEKVNASTKQTYESKTFRDEIDKEVSDGLVDILHSTHSSGAFVILDKDKMNLSYYPTLYLRDIEPNSAAMNNADILALYGTGATIKKLGFAFDPVWDVAIDLDEGNANSAFYYRPYQMAKSNAGTYTANELGYWSHPFRLQEDDVEIITYTIPLLDDNNEVYGIMGLEFSCDFLRSQLNYDELNSTQNSAYVIGTIEDNTANSTLVNGPLYDSLIERPITLESVYADTFQFIDSGDDQIAAVSTMDLYKPNTPFANEQWALFGVVKERSLLQNVYDLRHTLDISILLSMLAALCAALIVSYRFATPILSLAKRLKEGTHSGKIILPRIQISEIDALSESIEQLSEDVAYASSRMSRILQVVEIPIGVFTYNEHRDYVFCTEMLKVLLDFSEEAVLAQELSRDEFDREIALLNTKIVHRLEEQDDEVNNKNIDLICIKADNQLRWLRFHKIKHEDEMLVVVNDVSKEITEKQKLEEERDYDTLTSLLNRRAFRREVEEKLAVETTIGAMVMWDLDNLKYINDTYGHDAGDKYIRAAANVLTQLDGDKAVVARMAGDEFLAYIYGMDNETEIRKLVRKIHKDLLANSLELPDGTRQPIRASSGISWYPKDGETLDDLLRHADFAMYDAKNTIKGSIREFSKEIYERDELLFSGKEELNTLIDEKRVYFVYQPIVNAKTGEIYGFEALMRPISDYIKTTSDLFRLAKAQSKLHQMERLTWINVLEQYAGWIDKFGNRKIFINSLPNISLHPVDIEMIENKYGEFLHNVVIEIIENDDLDMECTALKQRFCEEHGTQIAIDDFGSGYNNEGMLLKITPQYIKIDMEIIQGISHDEDRQQFVQYMVQFAHSKNALVIAEGIEEVDDLRLCIELDVDLLQGFYIGFPDSEIHDIENAKKKRIRQFHKTN